MRLKAYEQIGGKVLDFKPALVVIEDDQGNPIMAAAEYSSPGFTILTKINDPDFERICRALGIWKPTVLEPLQMSGPPAGAELLFRPGDIR